MMRGAWRLARQYEYLFITSLAVTSVFLNWHLVLAVLPRYALEFGVPYAAAGLLISVFTLARIFLNFPAGAVVDRIGRRRVLIAGCAITALASVGSGIAPDFSDLVVMRFLTGVGGAIAITAQMTIMADISTPQNRGRMMSVNAGVVQVGTSLGPAVGGIIASSAGLRVPFFVAAGLTFFVTLWALLRLPETQGWSGERAKDQATGPGFVSGLITIFSIPNYRMITLVAFASFFTRFGTLFLLLPLVAYSDHIGMSVGEYGLLASAVAGSQALLLPLSGTLADRWGRKAMIVPSVVLTGLALIAYGLAPSRPWFLLAAAFYAIAAGLNGPAPDAYLADVAPSNLRGISMGAYRTVGDVAGLIAPVALGFVAESSFGQGAALIGNGILVALVGLAFAFFAGETVVRTRVAIPQPIAEPA